MSSHVRRGETTASFDGYEIGLLIGPEENGSGIAVLRRELSPGTLVGPVHRHSNEDQLTYVVAGELTVQDGDEVRTLAPGETAVHPRGQWHTHWNAGSEPVRYLEILTPGAGWEYYRELTEIWTGGPLDETVTAQAIEISARYGIEADYDSLPTLLERHGLTF